MSFLPGMFPAGAIAAAAPVVPPELTFVGYSEDGVQRTTYTFNTVSIGAADVTRRVVVVAHWRASLVRRTMSAATINGISILPANVSVSAANIDRGDISIFSLLVPTGTTANFSFTLNAAADDFSMGVFRAINESSASPHDTMTDTTPASNVLTGTLDIPANGWVVAGGNGSTATVTWAGATERYDDTIGNAGVAASGASDDLLAAEANKTVSMNTASTGCLAAMSWG